MLVDVVLRYCCGLIHPKAPSQSGPAPVPAACGEIHPHSEALLFRLMMMMVMMMMMMMMVDLWRADPFLHGAPRTLAAALAVLPRL